MADSFSPATDTYMQTSQKMCLACQWRVMVRGAGFRRGYKADGLMEEVNQDRISPAPAEEGTSVP